MVSWLKVAEGNERISPSTQHNHSTSSRPRRRWRSGAHCHLQRSRNVTQSLHNHPSSTLCRHRPAANIVFDYEYSLWGIPEGSSEREKMKHEVHLCLTEKLRDLCFKNGWIYIKLGQHLGQLEYLVPKEYVQTMRESMLNRCPVSSYEQICNVFKKEFGEIQDKVFAEFDPVPIASASLAQVHVARTHDG